MLNISERSEVSSNDFAGAFPKEYKDKKTYKIRKSTSLDVNVEKGKNYVIRLFPADKYEGILMKLIDEKGQEFAKNYYPEDGEDALYERDFSFSVPSATKYKLEIILPEDKSNISVVIASRELTEDEKPKIDAEGFSRVKVYNMNTPNTKSYEYTVVFSAGTQYKVAFEDENMKAQLISEDRKNVVVDFTSTSNEKSKTFLIETTGIYYLKVETATTNPKKVELYFKR